MSWRNWWQKPKRVSSHVCGVCGQRWATEKEYVEHLCPSRRGMRPTDQDFSLRR